MITKPECRGVDSLLTNASTPEMAPPATRNVGLLIAKRMEEQNAAGDFVKDGGGGVVAVAECLGNKTIKS